MAVVEVVREKCETIVFGDLKIGETFRWRDKIYLKYSMSRMDMDCAFSFEENLAVQFSGSAEVAPVKCKLIVEG